MIRDLIIKELNVKKLDSIPCIQAQFDKVAGMIMNGFILVVSGREYRLFEIEFYYSSAIHPDPFVHRHPQQLTRSRWYFHKKGAVFSPGLYRGVDLTSWYRESRKPERLCLRACQMCGSYQGIY